MIAVRVNEGRHPVSPERARQLLKIITDDSQPIPTKDIEEGHSFREVKEPVKVFAFTFRFTEPPTPESGGSLPVMVMVVEVPFTMPVPPAV